MEDPAPDCVSGSTQERLIVKAQAPVSQEVGVAAGRKLDSLRNRASSMPLSHIPGHRGEGQRDMGQLARNARRHVQTITVAIDQYAGKALGNRDFFLN